MELDGSRDGKAANGKQARVAEGPELSDGAKQALAADAQTC